MSIVNDSQPIYLHQEQIGSSLPSSTIQRINWDQNKKIDLEKAYEEVKATNLKTESIFRKMAEVLTNKWKLDVPLKPQMIKSRLHRIKIRKSTAGGEKREWSSEDREALVKMVRKKDINGASQETICKRITEAANKLKRTYHACETQLSKIERYGLESNNSNGLISKKFKKTVWTPAELEIVKDCFMKSTTKRETVQKAYLLLERKHKGIEDIYTKYRNVWNLSKLISTSSTCASSQSDSSTSSSSSSLQRDIYTYSFPSSQTDTSSSNLILLQSDSSSLSSPSLQNDSSSSSSSSSTSSPGSSTGSKSRSRVPSIRITWTEKRFVDLRLALDAADKIASQARRLSTAARILTQKWGQEVNFDQVRYACQKKGWTLTNQTPTAWTPQQEKHLLEIVENASTLDVGYALAARELNKNKIKCNVQYLLKKRKKREGILTNSTSSSTSSSMCKIPFGNLRKRKTLSSSANDLRDIDNKTKETSHETYESEGQSSPNFNPGSTFRSEITAVNALMSLKQGVSDRI